ncbi:MAG: three component ABC system middle component [Pseudomonadota bacterium]
MTAWHARTIEQRNLLNPAFCAVVLWQVAMGYRSEAAAVAADCVQLPIELAFVGSSLALRGQTREKLPGTVRTSLAIWVYDHPLERSAVAKGVVVLRPYVREALMFGAQYGLLAVTGRHVAAIDSAAKKMTGYLKQSSTDVRECARQAYFVGRWLYKGGSPSTVLALLGVQA